LREKFLPLIFKLVVEFEECFLLPQYPVLGIFKKNTPNISVADLNFKV
jgi:hypothetical protein